jgi:hypothetical protein
MPTATWPTRSSRTIGESAAAGTAVVRRQLERGRAAAAHPWPQPAGAGRTAVHPRHEQPERPRRVHGPSAVDTGIRGFGHVPGVLRRILRRHAAEHRVQPVAHPRGQFAGHELRGGRRRRLPGHPRPLPAAGQRNRPDAAGIRAAADADGNSPRGATSACTAICCSPEPALPTTPAG